MATHHHPQLYQATSLQHATVTQGHANVVPNGKGPTGHSKLVTLWAL